MLFVAYTAALIAILFVFALIVACVNDERRTEEIENAPVRTAIATEQQQEPSQANDVQHKADNGSKPIPWWLGSAVAIGLAFLGAAIFGIYDGWEAPGWTAYFSAAVVFSTLAQALVAKWQRDKMQEQLDLAREELRVNLQASKAAVDTVEHMRLEQRAWLSITAEITRLDVGWPLGVDFMFANSGRTPAMIRKVKIGADIPSNYSLVDYDQIVVIHTNDRPWDHRENTVAPNGSYNVHLEHGHVVTKGELDSLAPDKHGVLWLLVTVQYSDFADGRESQVLLNYDLSADRFRQWEKHNYMK